MSSDSNPAVHVTEREDRVLLMTLDLPGKGANILSAQMFDQLEEAITPYMDRSDIEGLVLFSGKPKIFVAGANLNEIQDGLDWPDERIVAFCERGRHVMSLFHEAPFTTVAAIQGACVGGGLELTLWCDYRIVSNKAGTVLGLPEVNLGLIPGWGGTVRVARLTSIETQIELVTSARLLSGSEAVELGLADQLAATDDLVESAAKWIRETSKENRDRRRRESDQPLVDVDQEELVRQFAPKISKPGNKIYPVAPLIALEHMVRAAELSLDEACHSESLAFAEAWGSPPSHGLLHHFFLNDYAKKLPTTIVSDHPTRSFKTVGIVGLGVMGASIARQNLKAGRSVVGIEPDAAIRQRVKEQLVVPNGCRLELFKDLTEWASTEGASMESLDLVIEATPELPNLKRKILGEIERCTGRETLIATNTSAISIEELKRALENPERFCGIHFCHPELMSLVEVIPSSSTSKDTLANALSYVKSLRKTGLVVKDSPGFAVNRLLSAMFQSSIELVLGGAQFWEVDEAIREFGFAAGPFEIMDVIGIDTCVLAGRAMWERGLRKLDTSPLLPKLRKLNRLGRKRARDFMTTRQ